MSAVRAATPVTAPSLLEAFPRLRQIERLDRRYVRRLEREQLRARRFADEHLRPVALDMDRRTDEDPSFFDWDLVRTGGREGMLDFLLPAQVGGGGCLTAQCALIMEELCAGCPGLALIFGAHSLGVAPLLLDGPLHWDVLGEIVESARRGEPILMAFALTEPDAGTDVEDLDLLARGRITSRARRVPGGYSLSGTKRFISNGSVARWITVMMPVDPTRPAETWTCFLVDARSSGFTVARTEHKMGQRACPAAELSFDEVFVPDQRVVGRVGDAAGATLTVLATSRPAVGAIATGIARGAYERLLAWLQESPDGRRLLERQSVQLRLATMVERLHLARQAYMDAAVEIDIASLGAATGHPLLRSLGLVPNWIFRRPAVRRMLNSPRTRDALAGFLNRVTSDAAVTRSLGLSSLAKAQGGDVAMSVTDDALQIAGLTDAPVRAELEKLWRDAKLCQIYEGTNQLNRIEVFRTLVQGETMAMLPPLPGRDGVGAAAV
ncbi:MAG: acyl-CoA dehydrogenase family protein [Thermoleophilia bacterium]|nr:acyl-CoA dehydrogenase family protein [Thermoleophilia bacterium]